MHSRLAFFIALLFSLPTFSALTCDAVAKEAFSKKFLQSLGKESKRRGISRDLWQETYRFLTKEGILEDVIIRDRQQPELVATFHSYTTRLLDERRISRGRLMLEEQDALLQRLELEYGVPSEILIGIWGLESNYGDSVGRFPVLHATASLSADGRRGKFFREQFLTALQIAEREGFSPLEMLGSWAGAMGQVQFIPTSYWQYARDGNGDGRVDIWNDVDDSLTSAAHYLKASGWRRALPPAESPAKSSGEGSGDIPGSIPWGLEVRLPAKFDYAQAHTWRSSAFWRKKGVEAAHKGQRARMARIGKSSLLLPAGARGPVFLVSQNFRSILRWNNSNLYALAVGLLADRLRGAPALSRKSSEQILRIDDIRRLQRRLNELGFASGAADAILGTQTKRALRKYQKSQGLTADGFPSPETLSSLGL